MTAEVDFYRVCQNGRIRLSEIRGPNDVLRAIVYLNSAIELGPNFGVDISSLSAIDPQSDPMDPESIARKFLPLEMLLEKIRARNIFLVESSLQREYVMLDESWRSQVSSYVQHIRTIVSKADAEERLKQAILGCLNTLQQEVDRNQSRLTTVTDTLITLCEAVGAGAKRLDPAVKLVERLAGSIGKLRRNQQEAATQPQLPAPDKLGLPAPDQIAPEE